MPFKVAVETLQNRASDSPLCVSLSFTILSIHRTTTLHAGIRLYLPLNIVVAETQHSTRRQFSLHQFICPSSSYRPHRVLHQVLTQLTSSSSHGEQSPSASIITRCWLADDVQSTQLFESIQSIWASSIHSASSCVNQGITIIIRPQRLITLSHPPLLQLEVRWAITIITYSHTKHGLRNQMIMMMVYIQMQDGVFP